MPQLSRFGRRMRMAITIASAYAALCEMNHINADTVSEESIEIDQEAVKTAVDTCTSESQSFNCEADFNWDRILRDGKPIVANGNVFPSPQKDTRHNCLILLTHSQVIWHCPDDGKSEVLHQEEKRRFRGIFAHPNSYNVWLLSSPHGTKMDLLEELDIERKKIVQTLLVPGSEDGHDAVRVGSSVFIVDTRHGDIIEVALPASAGTGIINSPGISGMQNATVIRRHKGFTRADHVNNVAVHPDLLLANLHGMASNKADKLGIPHSRTRLSALTRTSTGEGGELDQLPGVAVDNVGKWSHGIAFWEHVDSSQQANQPSRIKLISLDSSNGELVSVVLSGPGAKDREREVLWSPDLSHPALQNPNSYDKMTVFSKGLAVQGGVAYFGVSPAKGPKYRLTVNPTLLVAVDLETKVELWAREIESHGLINQVVSEAYLFRPMVEEAEQQTGQEETIDQAQENGSDEQNGTYDHDKVHVTDQETLQEPPEDDSFHPLILDEFSQITTFDLLNRTDKDTCHNDGGITRRLPLNFKEKEVTHKLKTHSNTDMIVTHLCTVNVAPMRDRLLEMGDDAFSEEGQSTNAKFTNRNENLDKIKPGVPSMILIFSDRPGNDIYHFPFLDDWLPLIQKDVLTPLQINVNNIVRMQFAKMTEGSTIRIHSDKGGWVMKSHRVHVPIITHPDIYFMSHSPVDTYMRIPSIPGEVYEFNNAVPHLVRNYGGNRIHLIIDWAEEEPESVTKLTPGQVCFYGGRDGVQC